MAVLYNEISGLLIVLLAFCCCAESEDLTHSKNHRGIRATPISNYDEFFTSFTPIPENANINYVLFDFKSISINTLPGARYDYEVIDSADSVPSFKGLFSVGRMKNGRKEDKRKLLFGNTLSDTERKNYFDFEQFPEVTVIVKATEQITEG